MQWPEPMSQKSLRPFKRASYFSIPGEGVKQIPTNDVLFTKKLRRITNVYIEEIESKGNCQGMELKLMNRSTGNYSSLKVDVLVSNCGFKPNTSLNRELQVIIIICPRKKAFYFQIPSLFPPKVDNVFFSSKKTLFFFLQGT